MADYIVHYFTVSIRCETVAYNSPTLKGLL